jgi:hypothetical protein
MPIAVTNFYCFLKYNCYPPLKLIRASLPGVVCQKFIVVTNWMSAQEILNSDSAPGWQSMVKTEGCQVHELLYFLIMVVSEPCWYLKYGILHC